MSQQSQSSQDISLSFRYSCSGFFKTSFTEHYLSFGQMSKSSWNAVEINKRTTGAKRSCWITSVKKEKQAFHVELLQSRPWHHSPRHYAQPASHNILACLGFYLSIHWKSTVIELLHMTFALIFIPVYMEVYISRPNDASKFLYKFAQILMGVSIATETR